MTEPYEVPDPTRHLLSQERFERLPDGSTLRRPVPLAEAVEAWRGLMKADTARRIELGLEQPQMGEPTIALTSEHALALVGMLEELSARLAPGTAVGAIQADREVSTFIEGAARLLRQRA